MSQSVTNPEVSIVIPARNEERWIGKCLNAVHSGSVCRSRYEIILIDNGSTDQTVEIARPLVDIVISEADLNVSQLRNAAVNACRGEIIAFLDADCIPAEEWLEAGIDALQDRNSIAGASYLLPDDPSRVETLMVSLESRPSRRSKTNFVPAGNLFIHKDFFTELGGFNSSLEAGEDKELCARANREGAVFYDPGIRVVHEGNPKTFYGLFRRELWHGRGILRTFKSNPGDKLVMATFMFSFGLVLIGLGAILALFIGSQSLWVVGFGFLVCGAAVGLSILKCFNQIKGLFHICQSAQFFLVYYIGRAGALFGALLSIPYYHNLTSQIPETVSTTGESAQ